MVKKVFNFLLLCFLFFSCENRSSRTLLSEIEPLLSDRAEEALARLSTIDTTGLNTSKLKADYALLYAMALDKNWIDTTNEDVVMPAIRYYDKRRPVSQRAKPYYYLGRIQYNGYHYDEAIVSFMRANQYSESLDDHRFKALTWIALANTYTKTSVYSDALNALGKAREESIACGDSLLLFSIDYYTAQSLVNTGRFSEATTAYEVLTKNDNEYARMIPQVYTDYAMFLITPPNQEYEEAKALYNKYLHLSGRFRTLQQLGMYTLCLAKTGETAKADIFLEELKKLSTNDSSVFLYTCSQIAALRGNYPSAYSTLYTYQQCLDKTVQLRLRQSAVRAQRDYFKLETASANKEAAQQKTLFLLISLLFVLAALWSFFSIRKYREKITRQNHDLMETVKEIIALRRTNQKKEEDIKQLLEKGVADEKTINRAIQQNDMLTQQLADVSEELCNIKESQQHIKQEFFLINQENFKELSSLCSTFYKNEGKSSQANTVCSEVRGYLKNIGLGASRYPILEKRVNELFNNVMKHLRQEHPNHREPFFQIACYLFAGFKIRTIALVLDQNEQNLYKTRSLLRKEVEATRTPHQNDFLTLLDGTSV